MTKRWQSLVWLLVAASIATVPAARASEIELQASDLTGSFGAVVALEGDLAVVGAPSDDAAYVFRLSGGVWSEEQILVPTSGATSFGSAVDIQGHTIVVAATDFALRDPRGGRKNPPPPPPGSVHVFTWDGSVWTEQQQLEASDAAPGDGFGSDVALDGDTLVVGAVGHEHPGGGGTNSGAVYVFTRTGSGAPFVEDQELVDGSGNVFTGWGLGTSVALDGDILLAASANDGSAFVYLRSGPGNPFVNDQRLSLPSFTQFSKVDVAGDLIVTSRQVVLRFGIVEVWTRSGPGSPYVFEQELDPAEPIGRYGPDLSIDGDAVFVRGRLPGSDRVYEFRRPGAGLPYERTARLEPCSGFGGLQAMAVDAGRVLVGVPRGTLAAGSAYFLEPCGGNQPPTANPGADRTVAAECANDDGTTDVTLDGSASSDPDGDVLSYTWTGAGFDPLTGEIVTAPLTLGIHTIELTVDDGNGGTDSATVQITVADQTPPEVTAPEPLVLTCTAIGADGKGQVSGSDPQVTSWITSASAVDACDLSPSLTDDGPATYPTGSTTVTFTAVDADGNSANDASEVRVEYAFGGFEPPLMSDNSASIKQSKQGRTIPVKFSLSCGDAAAGAATATLSVYQVLDAATGTTDTTDMTEDSGSSNDEGNVFRYDPADEHYIYNLSTAGFDADATYRIVVDIDDGSRHEIDFSLR